MTIETAIDIVLTLAKRGQLELLPSDGEELEADAILRVRDR